MAAAPGNGRFSLDSSEVEQLWDWLKDGSIMRPAAIRAQLRRGWGLCPRHTWAHAAVECELRSQPFTTATLTRDLTSRAAQTLRSPPRQRSTPMPQMALRSSAACVACQWLATAPADGDAGSAERCQRVNRLERTRGYLAESRPVWAVRSCPQCRGGGGICCRPHLLAAGASSVDTVRCAEELDTLGERLDTLIAAMTVRGPAATTTDRAALVEALGWLTGWGLVEHIARPAGSRSP